MPLSEIKGVFYRIGGRIGTKLGVWELGEVLGREPAQKIQLPEAQY